MARGNPHPVSRKGVPNKATSDARAAIARFVDGNAHRLTLWLDQVANGVFDYYFDEEGLLKQRVIVEPDPGRAFDLYQKVIQYHVPKLAQVDSTVAVTQLPKVQLEFIDGSKPGHTQD
jgi:hypothetical protein